MLITRKSPFSGRFNDMEIDVSIDEIRAWEDGELPQNAMPRLTSDECDFITTGITPEEWRDVFGDEE